MRKAAVFKDIQEEDLKGFGRLIKFGDEGEKGVKGEFFCISPVLTAAGGRNSECGFLNMLVLKVIQSGH